MGLRVLHRYRGAYQRCAGGRGIGRDGSARIFIQGAGFLSAGRALMKGFEALPSLRVSGIMAVPGDKSISHRALMLSGIAEGVSEVKGFLASEDCMASLAAMRALGVQIEQPTPTHVMIHGAGMGGLKNGGGPLDMGNAGTAMRLFTGLLSAQSFDSQ